MKRKNFFLVVTVKAKRQLEEWQCYYGNPKPMESGYYSFVLPVSVEDDITSILVNIRGYQRCDVYTNKKEAAMVADAKRAQFRENGTYLFSDWPNYRMA